ncbi:carbon storage regulator [Helicobacter monodelphidis]|uniref:carbon storage regulator CsrA n=1 Tax=Helicobacter sp. 15-1451 TaxID=2004995 RepID=UPI000DCD1406|nr:carbon storage regulator CsrA [Helicobacter sp. 15-1451]RAX58120.1 carbon storage regulator [Helicobacter sp. 15-1451]
MLILARKEDESIVIGDEIVIKVVSIDRGTVKLGFEAPSRFVILREELRQMVADKNKQSISGNEIANESLGHLSKILPHKNGTPHVKIPNVPQKNKGK